MATRLYFIFVHCDALFTVEPSVTGEIVHLPEIAPFEEDFYVTCPRPLAIVVLKKRRLRRELKDLDFSFASMERRERQGSSLALRTTNSAMRRIPRNLRWTVCHEKNVP